MIGARPLPGTQPRLRLANDMAENERKKWFEALRPCSLIGPMSPASPADVGSWNILYQVATELDLAMPEAFQRQLAGRAKEAEAEVRTNDIESGHFVQITHAQEVAAWIANICQG